MAHLISIKRRINTPPPFSLEKSAFLTSDQTNRPLRISFLIFRPSMSGGARVIAKYARMLKERGHEVFLTGLGAPPLTMKQTLKQWLGLRPRWTDPPSHYALEGLDMRLIGGRERLTTSDLPDADVVVATYWRTAEWLADLPPEKGSRAYFVQHHEAEFPHADRSRAEATYRSDCRIIAVSSWITDVLAERYGRKDAALVLNAVDAAQFAPREPRRKQKRPTIGFMGSRNATKRVDIAVAASELLREKFPDLRVRVLAADKPNGVYVMHDWFEPAYNPPQDQLKDVYADCDVWLFTSDIEGYGLPLLESLASGTPLVARPAGAAPDLVNGANGVLVDSSDPSAIADAAARILALAPDDWKKMSEAALVSANAHDWIRSFEAFEAALRAVADKRWPPVMPAEPSR